MLPQTDLTRVVVLDIETVPQYADHDSMPPHFQQLWELKTRNQRKDQSPEAYYERAGIWAEFGKIICISCGRIIRDDNGYNLRIKSFFGDDEQRLLSDFCAMAVQLPADVLFCAHNGKEFDFPYLCRRMLINRLPIPPLLQILGKKPWEVPFLDTMEMWRFGDFKNYISLNLLAAVFDIPSPKDDIDGSEVAEVYYREKNLARIVNYCQKDVATTAQILLRFNGFPLIPNANITYLADA